MRELGNEGCRSGSIKTFGSLRAHLPRKSRRNPGFPGRNFSIEKNSLLRPRFLEFPGPGEEIFLHRYFWDWKCSLLPGIFRKKGSDYEKNFHRPRRQIMTGVPRIRLCRKQGRIRPNSSFSWFTNTTVAAIISESIFFFSFFQSKVMCIFGPNWLALDIWEIYSNTEDLLCFF